MSNSSPATQECPGCKIKRASLSRGSWCTICGYNPVYEEKLRRVMSEVNQLSQRLK